MFVRLLQDIPCDKFVPLAQTNNRVGVVVSGQKIYQLTNVCPHQNSLISCTPTDNLVCPYHGLKYDLQGQGQNHDYKLMQLPAFCHNNLVLTSRAAKHWPVDLQHMILQEYRVDKVAATVEIVMDVFLDIDHIPHAHTGVYDQIGIHDTTTVQTHLYDDSCIQIVPGLTDLTIGQDRCVGAGAVWFAVYPGTMIEWQPGALFVTVATNTHQVHVFKYRDSRYPLATWYINSATWEQAWNQDRQLAENIVTLPNLNLNNLKQHHRDWLDNAVSQ